MEPDWHERAECRGSDPDLWFPLPGDSTAPAKAVCRVCPVREECLNEALELGEPYGIRGGLSARERAGMRPGHLRGRRLGPGAVAHCGTNAGYYRHLRTGETPCPPCREAHAAYTREYDRRRRAS